MNKKIVGRGKEYWERYELMPKIANKLENKRKKLKKVVDNKDRGVIY